MREMVQVEGVGQLSTLVSGIVIDVNITSGQINVNVSGITVSGQVISLSGAKECLSGVAIETNWPATNPPVVVYVTGVVLTSGGGGTTILPATSVTDERTFNIAPAVGVGVEYSRQDHTHGTPTIPASGQVLISASGTVLSSGQISSNGESIYVGSGTQFAPAYSFSHDKGTGMYSVASGSALRLAIGQVLAFGMYKEAAGVFAFSPQGTSTFPALRPGTTTTAGFTSISGVSGVCIQSIVNSGVKIGVHSSGIAITVPIWDMLTNGSGTTVTSSGAVWQTNVNPIYQASGVYVTGLGLPDMGSWGGTGYATTSGANYLDRSQYYSVVADAGMGAAGGQGYGPYWSFAYFSASGDTIQSMSGPQMEWNIRGANAGWYGIMAVGNTYYPGRDTVGKKEHFLGYIGGTYSGQNLHAGWLGLGACAIRHYSGDGANWKFWTGGGGGITTIDTGIPFVQGQVKKVNIQTVFKSGSYTAHLYVDNVYVTGYVTPAVMSGDYVQPNITNYVSISGTGTTVLYRPPLVFGRDL